MGKFIIRTPIFFLLVMFFFSSCLHEGNEKHLKTKSSGKIADLSQIRERGKLIAITDYNSVNYFIYRGQPMGYQFDMLRQLADHLQLKLEVVVNNNLDESFDNLESGDCDIIAVNLAVTGNRKNRFNFTEPHTISKQVLVQKKPAKWYKLTKDQLEASLIRNQLDLAGKTIYVPIGSAFASRLKNLAEEIGDSINIVEVPEETEKLVTMVAEGEIEFTVADENIALVNQTYFADLDIKTPISFPQKIAWAVRKNSPELEKEINLWITSFKSTARYANIYNKYFKNTKSASIVTSNYYVINTGKISDYDEIIKKASENLNLNWDWRLLSSLIYQESHFNAGAVSWAGAYGLMQIMPTTGIRFGVDSSSSPTEHIYAGVKFLKWLDKRWSKTIKNPEERIKFILGSYNVGLGHVQDAQRLALKYGKNPNIWEENVDIYLKYKSEPKYFSDPVVKYGYCRGEQPYKYVREILERYEHYKNIIPDAALASK